MSIEIMSNFCFVDFSCGGFLRNWWNNYKSKSKESCNWCNLLL